MQSHVFAEEELMTAREDNIPKEHLANGNDEFLSGYIQALLDVHYHEFNIEVKVNKRKASLANLPSNDLLAKSIESFVADIPDIDVVNVRKEKASNKQRRSTASGSWFPQSTMLFNPFIADPRQSSHSLGYRFNDNVAGRDVFAMSVGEIFPIYRWHNFQVGRFFGDLQLSLEPGVWSVFDTSLNSFPLINTDFRVAVPLTFAFAKWAFRARAYHYSTHLGDEYILQNNITATQRKNVSVEAVDFFTSYQLTDAIRVYGGAGMILHKNKEHDVHPLFAEYGLELRLLGEKNLTQKLHWEPFLAMHFRNWEDFHWNTDQTYALGVEWGKLQGVGRKVRVYLEYHDGYSLEGQFSKMESDYLAFRLSYGF